MLTRVYIQSFAHLGLVKELICAAIDGGMCSIVKMLLVAWLA